VQLGYMCFALVTRTHSERGLGLGHVDGGTRAVGSKRTINRVCDIVPIRIDLRQGQMFKLFVVIASSRDAEVGEWAAVGTREPRDEEVPPTGPVADQGAGSPKHEPWSRLPRCQGPAGTRPKHARAGGRAAGVDVGVVTDMTNACQWAVPEARYHPVAFQAVAPRHPSGRWWVSREVWVLVSRNCHPALESCNRSNPPRNLRCLCPTTLHSAQGTARTTELNSKQPCAPAPLQSHLT